LGVAKLFMDVAVLFDRHVGITFEGVLNLRRKGRVQCAAVKKRTSGSTCTAAVAEHPVGRPIVRSGQAHHVGLATGAPLVPCVLFALSVGLFSNIYILDTMENHVCPCPNYQFAVSNIYWCCCGSGTVSAGRLAVLVQC